MPQNIKLYKAANDIVIEVGPGRKILPTTDSDINIVVDPPVLRFNLTSEHLDARAGTASNEIDIVSATGQVVLKDIDHVRLRRSNGNTFGSTRDAVISVLNGGTLFGATLIDTRIATNASDISDVESDISTIQSDISSIESDVLSLSKALKSTTNDRGIFLDDSKDLTSSFLRIQPAENKLQTGTTGNTFYASTESSPGGHRFAVQAGASGSESSVTALSIDGSSSAVKATATFGATTAVSLGSTLSVTGNTVLRNLSFSSTNSPHLVNFNNASVSNLSASSISSGTFANARISASSVLQHADNYGSWNLKTGGTQRTTVSSGGDLNLVGGSGISLAYSAGGTVTITNSASSFDGAFSSLTGTPTTIAGYGITDALELGSTSTTALAGDTTTITTAQANAITANTAKTSFPGFGTTAGTALEGDTELLQLGTTSTTALAGDTTTITTAQANAITANSAKTSFPGFGTTAGTALEGDTALFSGAYADLTGKPTIPTNNNELTNGAGYITSYTVTEGDVTAHEAALSVAYSQLTGVPSTFTPSAHTHTASAITDFDTEVSNNTSVAANTAKVTFPGFGTTAGTALEGDTALFSGAYADLTGKPSLFDGDYNSLTNLPTLFDGDYNSLSNRPTLFSGAFGDLTGKPTTISGYGITDAFDGSAASLTGTLNMARIADDAITGAKIAHNTLDAIHINASAIGASELNVAGNGTSGQLLASDGDGTFSWVNAVSDTNTNIANADLTLDADHLVTLDGNELTFRSSSTQNHELLVIADDGNVTIGAGSGQSGATLALREVAGNGSNFVALKAPDSLSASLTFTLPSVDGSNGQVLTTNGSGSLAFTTISDTNTNIGNTDFTLSASRKITVAGYDFGLYDSTYVSLFLWDDSEDVFKFSKPVVFQNTSGYTSGEIRLKEYPAASGDEYVGFKAPGSIAANCLWTLPSADGTNGQVLTTDGSKALSWTTVSGGGASETWLADMGGLYTWSSTDSGETVAMNLSYGEFFYSHSTELSQTGLSVYGSGQTINSTTSTIDNYKLQMCGFPVHTTDKKVRCDYNFRIQSAPLNSTWGISIWSGSLSASGSTDSERTVTLRGRVSDITANPNTSTVVHHGSFTTTSAINGGFILPLLENRTGTLTTTTRIYGRFRFFLVD